MPADDVLQRDLWQQIDEQSVPNHVRRELSRNGFRAGIVGNVVPVELARALQLEEAQIQRDDGNNVQQETLSDSAEPVDLTSGTSVTRQWRRLRPGQRAEINASDILPSMPVLLCDENGLHGETFEHVQAVYDLRVAPASQAQATFELTPELQFGPSKTRYTGGEGPFWRMEIARDRRIFETMRIPVTLRPGQMLVVGADTASVGSLGDHFHRVDAAKGAGRRLIVIRLAQTPES